MPGSRQGSAARENREAFAHLPNVSVEARPTDAARLRASQVWDTRANPLLARAQSGHPEGGALISGHTLSQHQKRAKKELDAALAAQARDDARVARAQARVAEVFGDRYQDVDADVFRRASGEIVPNTRTHRLAENNPTRWRDPAAWEATQTEARRPLPAGIPQTREAYMAMLAAEWGPTWASGPTWRLGSHSTSFRCIIASCMKGCERDAGGLHKAPRRGEARAYIFDDKYSFDAAGRLAWYLDDEGGLHFRDGSVANDLNVPTDDNEAKAYLVERYGAAAMKATAPRGKLYYRMETLPGRIMEFTLTFDTAFLAERMRYGEPFGAVGPFLPAPGTWAFAQDSKLPLSIEPLLQLMRDKYDFEWPTEKYMPFDALYRRAKATAFYNYNTDEARDVEYRRKSWALSKFHEECKEFTHIDSSASFLALIEHVVPHDAGPAAPVAPTEQELGEANVPQLLAHKHFKLNVNPAATTLAEWLVQPARVTPEARELLPVCVEEDFIATWATSITDAWAAGNMSVPDVFLSDGVPRFTVASILTYLGQTKGTRLTIGQHKRLLGRFGIGADWYDDADEMVAHIPNTRHDVTPHRAIYKIKNGHLYRLDLDMMALWKAEHTEEKEEKALSDRYPLSKVKSVRVFIGEPDEIIRFDRSSYPKGTRFDVRLNSPLHALLKTLRTSCSLDPDVAFSGAGLTPTRVSFNVEGHMLTFQNPISPGCMQVSVDQFVPSEAYLSRYDDLSRAFFESIARPKNLSTFGDEFLEWIKPDNRGPLKGFLPGYEPGEPTSEVDICRAYPTSLHGMDFMPVCIETDRPAPYDGHKIESWTLYDVIRDCEIEDLPSVGLQVLLNNKANRITGRTLLRFWDKLQPYVTVNSFFRPYRLIKNDSCKYIERILRDNVLTPEHKKHMLVHGIGRMGKKHNTRQEVRLYSTEGEAMHAKAERKGNVERYPHEFYRDEATGNSRADEWYVYKGEERKKGLKTGFWLAKLYLFCDARGSLAETCFELEAEGLPIVGLNTDAAFIPGSHTTSPLDKTDPANLGKRSRTPKAAPDYKLRWGNNAVLVWGPGKAISVENVTLENEYSCHELGKLHSDVLLLGACAGAGKTSMALSTINKFHDLLKPALFITPNNHQRKERLREGVEHVDTFFHIMMQRFGDDGEAVNVGGEYRYRRDKEKPLGYFKSVVLDEIMSLDAASRGRLERLVEQLREKGIRVFATGDADQLVIEHNLNPTVDLTKYINEWSRRPFPTAVVLREPKRFPLAKDKELVLGLKARLDAVKWDAPAEERRASLLAFVRPYKLKWCSVEEIPADARVISYTNNTRARVNDAMHYRKHDVPYEVGGTLVYRNKSRKQGCEMLYTNFTYVINAVSDENFKLAEEGDPKVTFTLARANVEKWFTFPYASTVHSAQGATYDGPTVICDLFHPRVDKKWLYVAMTRAKHPRQDIYLLRGRPPAEVDVHAIRVQIAGHLKADADLGRAVAEPITVDWVLARDAEQEGKCALCGEPYEMMRVGVAASTASASVDRIGHRGHEQGNCQLCCRSCNFSKRDRLV